MGLFSKLIGKKEDTQKEELINDEQIKEYKENNDIASICNYMLSDVKKDDIDNRSIQIPINKVSEIGPLAISSVDTIKTVIKENPPSAGKMYRVTNLGKNDTLKSVRDGKAFWGTIKKSDGSSTIAKLKEVKPNEVTAVDPAMLMMTATLYNIEKELGEIKELTKKIIDFLESEKEAQIETDLELLKKIMIELKYNAGNDKFTFTYYNQIADIVRNAHKNIITYKEKIQKELSKTKLFTTDGNMKTICEDMLKTIKYYRLSLFIYSFATYIELFLNGNFKSEYMLGKRDSLNELVNTYNEKYNMALEYIKKNANKSLKGNVLSGLGSAGNAVGNLVEKVKDGSVENWIHEKSDNLKQSGESIKENYVTEFDKMRDTHVEMFINQIERLEQLYNKTTDIYFDKDNIYLQVH